MRIALAVALFIALAGCSHAAKLPGPSTEPYLVDPSDPGLDGPYDILETYVQELNGSFVVTVTFRNFRAQDGNLTLPHVEIRVDLERDGRRGWFYAENQPDFTKAAPHVKYVMGRWDAGQYDELVDICAEHTVSAPEPPYLVRMEFPNENTTLADGPATLHAIHVESADFEGTHYDSADLAKKLGLRGGPNPHDTCPLVAERPR